MCHTIEDPTFDATAYATNPRARIRPIHRPPRVPTDRHPHCHWTIVIDPENDPVGPAALTRAGRRAPARVRAERAGRRAVARRHGRLPRRVRPRLPPHRAVEQRARGRRTRVPGAVAPARERGRARARDRASSADVVRTMLAKHWVGVAWLTSERLADRLGARDGGAAGVAAVLALQPILPPGFARDVSVDGDRVRARPHRLGARSARSRAPGSPGLLAHG